MKPRPGSRGAATTRGAAARFQVGEPYPLPGAGATSPRARARARPRWSAARWTSRNAPSARRARTTCRRLGSLGLAATRSLSRAGAAMPMRAPRAGHRRSEARAVAAAEVLRVGDAALARSLAAPLGPAPGLARADLTARTVAARHARGGRLGLARRRRRWRLGARGGDRRRRGRRARRLGARGVRRRRRGRRGRRLDARGGDRRRRRSSSAATWARLWISSRSLDPFICLPR